MTDVLLKHEPDGGNIEVVGGHFTMSDGLYVAVYLSLFGGNELDDGSQATAHLQWWGNLEESEDARRYRSRFQNLVRSAPMVPGNLRQFEQAADVDLAWFLEAGIATFVQTSCSLVAVRTLKTTIKIEVDDESFSFSFVTDASQE